VRAEEARLRVGRLATLAMRRRSSMGMSLTVLRVFEQVSIERAEKLAALRAAARSEVLANVSQPYKRMRALAIKLRPCPVAEIFVAATALYVAAHNDPEYTWLPEMLHSFTGHMPAGYCAQEGPADGGVIYYNTVTQSSSHVHPFIAEAKAVAAAVAVETDRVLKRNAEYRALEEALRQGDAKFWPRGRRLSTITTAELWELKR
jgi:hypothetical protein